MHKASYLSSLVKAVQQFSIMFRSSFEIPEIWEAKGDAKTLRSTFFYGASIQQISKNQRFLCCKFNIKQVKFLLGFTNGVNIQMNKQNFHAISYFKCVWL